MSKLAEMNIRAKYATYDSDGNKIGASGSGFDRKNTEVIKINYNNMQDFLKYFTVEDTSWSPEYVIIKVKPEYRYAQINLAFSEQEFEDVCTNILHKQGLSGFIIPYMIYNPLGKNFADLVDVFSLADMGITQTGDNQDFVSAVIVMFGQGNSSILFYNEMLFYFMDY